MKLNSALELSELKLCIRPKGRHYRDQVNPPRLESHHPDSYHVIEAAVQPKGFQCMLKL